MRIFKGLLLASITTPVLVFVLILSTGFIFTIIEYLRSSTGLDYIGGGAIGGSVYAFGTAIISIPATFLIGYPLASYAIYKNKLSIYSILVGAILSGALAFVVFLVVFISEYTDGLLTFAVIIGALGGLCNGTVFWFYMKKHNKSLNLTGTENAPPS